MLRRLAAALLVAGVSAQSGVVVEETVSVQLSSTTNLPPFTSIDVGYRGCMPLSVTVQSGPSYTLEMQGASPAISSLISADVSADGTCILSIKSPGFQDVSGVALTLTVPDNSLRSLTVGGSANVYLSVQPAANFGVSAYGNGWVKLEPGQSLSDGNLHVYLSGSNSVAICPTQFSTAASLDVHNSGSGSVVISNTNAGMNNIELSGTGPISISAGAAPKSTGHVSLSGSSSITVGAEQVSVDLRGMGDMFLGGAKNVRGSLSGIGHVHVPVDASCFLSTSGMGGCDQNNSPPYPPVSCDSLGPDGIFSANAVHWTVSVHGNQCSSSSWIKGVQMSKTETVMDGAVAGELEQEDGTAGVAHGHRVPDPCCTTGYSYTGTHCITHGEHHRCCVEGGKWTCAPGGVLNGAAEKIGDALAAVIGLVDRA